MEEITNTIATTTTANAARVLYHQDDINSKKHNSLTRHMHRYTDHYLLMQNIRHQDTNRSLLHFLHSSCQLQPYVNKVSVVYSTKVPSRTCCVQFSVPIIDDGNGQDDGQDDKGDGDDADKDKGNDNDNKDSDHHVNANKNNLLTVVNLAEQLAAEQEEEQKDEKSFFEQAEPLDDDDDGGDGNNNTNNKNENKNVNKKTPSENVRKFPTFEEYLKQNGDYFSDYDDYDDDDDSVAGGGGGGIGNGHYGYRPPHIHIPKTSTAAAATKAAATATVTSTTTTTTSSSITNADKTKDGNAQEQKQGAQEQTQEQHVEALSPMMMIPSRPRIIESTCLQLDQLKQLIATRFDQYCRGGGGDGASGDANDHGSSNKQAHQPLTIRKLTVDDIPLFMKRKKSKSRRNGAKSKSGPRNSNGGLVFNNAELHPSLLHLLSSSSSSSVMATSDGGTLSALKSCTIDIVYIIDFEMSVVSNGNHYPLEMAVIKYSLRNSCIVDKFHRLICLENQIPIYLKRTQEYTRKYIHGIPSDVGQRDFVQIWRDFLDFVSVSNDEQAQKCILIANNPTAENGCFQWFQDRISEYNASLSSPMPSPLSPPSSPSPPTTQSDHDDDLLRNEKDGHSEGGEQQAVDDAGDSRVSDGDSDGGDRDRSENEPTTTTSTEPNEVEARTPVNFCFRHIDLYDVVVDVPKFLSLLQPDLSLNVLANVCRMLIKYLKQEDKCDFHQYSASHYHCALEDCCTVAHMFTDCYRDGSWHLDHAITRESDAHLTTKEHRLLAYKMRTEDDDEPGSPPMPAHVYDPWDEPEDSSQFFD